MAIEVISEIQKAEQYAKETLVQANKDSKDITSKATLQAEEIYKQILDAAKKEANGFMQASISEGNYEAEKLFAKGKEDCKNIIAPAQDKVDEAVKLVIERIVNIHGNS
ncbi:MAG: ATPase [Sarcina sp.]